MGAISSLGEKPCQLGLPLGFLISIGPTLTVKRLELGFSYIGEMKPERNIN